MTKVPSFAEFIGLAAAGFNQSETLGRHHESSSPTLAAALVPVASHRSTHAPCGNR